MWSSVVGKLTALAAMQRRGGRKGTDIVGIARMPLNRIPIHDDEAIAAAAEQRAVTSLLQEYVDALI